MDNLNAVAGLFGLLGIAACAALLLGGIYALFCLTRAASGMERLAAAVEELALQERERRAAPLPGLPGATAFTPPVASPPPHVLEPIVLEETS